MKKFMLKDFRNFCSTKLIGYTFLFSQDNQAWETIENTMRLELCFDQVVTIMNPNMILFKNKFDSVRFDRVKYVIINSVEEMGDFVINIVCGGNIKNPGNRCYTMVASKKLL